MKNKTSLILFLLCWLPLQGFGQSLDHDNWRLSSNEEKDSVLSENIKDYPYHYLKYKTNEQIFIDKETDQVNKYIAVHAKVHINSQKGIDEFSSIYQKGTQEYFQYRIINSEGEVLTKSDENEEKTTTYNFDFTNLAQISNFDFSQFLGGNAEISGLDTNCQLEYIFVTKKTGWGEKGDKYGAQLIQKNVPIYNFEFNLITPDIIVYKTDEFNGCPKAEKDESDDKNYLTIEKKFIPAFHKSSIIANRSNRMGFLFVWYKLTSRSKTQVIYEYSYYSRVFYEAYMKENQTNNKLVSKYLKKIPEMKNISGLKRVELLDVKAKEDFSSSYSKISLKEGLKDKKLSSTSRLQLYTSALNIWGEKFQLVLPNSRKYLPFLETYDNPIYLDDIILYIPKYDVYISPNSEYNPVGLPASVFRENRAIFVKETGVQDFTSAKYDIDSILPLDYKLNQEKSSFTVDLNKNKIDVSTELSGMRGLIYFNQLKDINYQQKEDLFAGLSKVSFDDALLASYELKEVQLNDNPLTVPVKFDYSFTSKSLKLQEENTIKVNIGKIINDAINEQKKPKGNYPADIYTGYIHIKTIRINIPQGYSVTNLDDLNINVKHADQGIKDAVQFTVTPVIANNLLTITVKEVFKKGVYSPVVMDGFLEVFNSGWNLQNLQVELMKK